MLSDHVKAELARIVGDGNASFAVEDLLCYSYDATNSPVMPEAVVFPRSSDEISLILKMANSERFPVVPRGAGTGFTGGSVPVSGGVVLSTERMIDIIEVDAENMTAVVEPGVNTWEFAAECEKLGLFYPPDPTSLKFSTIGGNIAECAGGPRAVKYGVTRDYVLGLEVVLPTGEVVETGVRTVKGVVGYDLTRLMVGSEGTLGVVTRATLRLVPMPESRITMLAVFDGLDDAAKAVSAIMKARIIPSTLEYVDHVSLGCVEQYEKLGYADAGALLLIEVDGTAEATEREARAVREICEANNSAPVRTATGKYEVKDLWKARRALSASLLSIKPNKLNEDVVVPRSRVPGLVGGVEEIAASRGVLIACFGHAGDGNIHVNVMYDREVEAEERAARAAVKDVFSLVLSLGGTISGEHGVGTAKAPYMGMELSEAAIDAMRRIKETLDPKNILNPGKIFPASGEARQVRR